MHKSKLYLFDLLIIVQQAVGFGAKHLHIAADRDNHASASSLICLTGWMLFLTPKQQCQSTEGK